jgi:hypothetical protein
MFFIADGFAGITEADIASHRNRVTGRLHSYIGQLADLRVMSGDLQVSD